MLECNSTCERLIQPEKREFEIILMFLGILINLSDLQKENVPSPRICKLSGNVIVLILVFLNAYAWISSIPECISTSSRLILFQNNPVSIIVMLFGILICLRL